MDVFIGLGDLTICLARGGVCFTWFSPSSWLWATCSNAFSCRTHSRQHRDADVVVMVLHGWLKQTDGFWMCWEGRAKELHTIAVFENGPPSSSCFCAVRSWLGVRCFLNPSICCLINMLAKEKQASKLIENNTAQWGGSHIWRSDVLPLVTKIQLVWALTGQLNEQKHSIAVYHTAEHNTCQTPAKNSRPEILPCCCLDITCLALLTENQLWEQHKQPLLCLSMQHKLINNCRPTSQNFEQASNLSLRVKPSAIYLRQSDCVDIKNIFLDSRNFAWRLCQTCLDMSAQLSSWSVHLSQRLK